MLVIDSLICRRTCGILMQNDISLSIPRIHDERQTFPVLHNSLTMPSKRLRIQIATTQCFKKRYHNHIVHLKREECGCLQVQRLRGNDIASNLVQGLLEFCSQLIRTHDFARLCHLTDEFLKTTEETNERAFVNICHFAKTLC